MAAIIRRETVMGYYEIQRSDEETEVTCRSCGRTESNLGRIRPFGMYWGENDRPNLILYRCACSSVGTVRWDDAPEPLRELAMRVDAAPPARPRAYSIAC